MGVCRNATVRFEDALGRENSAQVLTRRFRCAEFHLEELDSRVHFPVVVAFVLSVPSSRSFIIVASASEGKGKRIKSSQRAKTKG